jgi:hypothetical protein
LVVLKITNLWLGLVPMGGVFGRQR